MSKICPEILENRRNQDAIRGRLRWLEDRICWVGELNRSDLIAKFGISPQQASLDITLYRKIAPGNLMYDGQKKVYLPAIGLTRVFHGSDLSFWLTNNADESKELRSIPMVRTGMIERFISNDVIRALSYSFHARRPLRIKYQGMRNPTEEERTICPHCIVDTGVRWHVRAWHEERKEFRDMVISRILSASLIDNTEWVPCEADHQWNSFVDIILVPLQRWSPDQRKIVEKDFMMEGGRRIVRVRTALAYYYLAAMNLLGAIRLHQGVPQDQVYGVAVENWRELQSLV